MASLKTAMNDSDIEAFLDSIEHPVRKENALTIFKMMNEVTGLKPKMWGSSIVGYGSYHYKYQSGREVDWFVTGFSPRKQSLTIYIMPGFDGYEELMSKLGIFKTGKSCLYINKLTDVDIEVLKTLIIESANYMNQKYNS